MEGNIIKSFLVGLGFNVDDSSLSKFNKAINDATIKVAALYATIKVAAAGIFWGISKISDGFEQMGYELRLIAPTLNKTLVLRQELMKAYAAAGINLQKVIVQSVEFNMSLTKTQYALKAIYTSVGAKFFPLLTKQMDIFRRNIYANMPKIQAALTTFVNVVFKAFEATVILGERIWSILQRAYDFFVILDRATNGWSTVILAVVAAWRILNLAFLATPLGALITGILTLIALYDDFQVWKDGGQAFFNWSKALPYIQAMGRGLDQVAGFLGTIFGYVMLLGDALVDVFSGKFIKGFGKWQSAFQAMGMDLAGLMKGMDVTLQGGSIGSQPLGTQSAGNTNQTNQNVSQQTSINIMGSADALATGKAVSSEQSKVNFNLTRNLKSATQ